MKKSLVLLLIITIIAIPVLAASQFADLPDSHWGYKNVEKLVNDGTVRGYEDGTFRPDNTVTRAEFVKMMGMGTERKSEDYTDVAKDHWGYDYIMTSGFETESTEFLPDRAITRGEAITLLWKRMGSTKNLLAPLAVTNQNPANKDAVAWAYNFKIMMGDDGLNLRLSDSISRVEAAALIIRTRETDYTAAQSSFKDTVSESVLKAAFESFPIFDDGRKYDANAKITNGELARAMIRFAAYEYNLSYSLFKDQAKFDGEFGRDVTILANNCLGESYATEEFANKNATVEDALTAFTYALIKKSNSNLSLGNTDNYYKDVTLPSGSIKNVYLTFAYENGIHLNADGTIGALNEVTHKDLASMFILLDGVCGTQTLYSTYKNEDGTAKKYDAKLNLNPATYPANASDYICIIEGADKAIYEKPIEKKPEAKPSLKMFSFSREFAEMFSAKIRTLADHIKSTYGVDAELIMYPNLVWDNGSGFTLRMKCVINGVPNDQTPVESVFEGTFVTLVTGNMYKGMTFFVELNTGYAIFM